LLIHFGPRRLGSSNEFQYNSSDNTIKWVTLTTPSIAMYNNFLGRTIANIRSIHWKMATIISSSFLGAGLQLGIHQVTKKFSTETDKTLLVLRMCTRMNDAIHVKI
jgi:hypothetical protein